MSRINATITAIDPVFVGGDKSGNIQLPYMIHVPHSKKTIVIKKEIAEELIKCVGSFYRNCNKDNFGSRSFTEAFRDRVFAALCSSTISQFFTNLLKHLPIAEPSFYQYTTKFAFGLSKDENLNILQWARENIDLFVAAAIYQTESFNFREGFVISEDILTTESDFLVPTIPGNSIRGRMRDQLMAYVTKIVFENADPHQIYEPKAYHTLFSGGMLTKSTGFVDIATKRELREKLPFLSILGAMIGNEDLPGKINVNFAHLHCMENGQNDRPAISYLKEYFMTRVDDYEGAITPEWQAELGGSHVQMFYSILAMEAGCLFNWSVDHFYLNEVETAFLHLMLTLFAEDGKIGGMSRAGFGKINVCYDQQLDPTLANSFLTNQRDAIKATLNQLNLKK
jgi:hypothetical protein